MSLLSDALQFQGLGAILDWLTTRLDFMGELWIPLTKGSPAAWLVPVWMPCDFQGLGACNYASYLIET